MKWFGSSLDIEDRNKTFAQHKPGVGFIALFGQAVLNGVVMVSVFKQLEAVRWNMDDDIPWASFEAAKLTEEQAAEHVRDPVHAEVDARQADQDD